MSMGESALEVVVGRFPFLEDRQVGLLRGGRRAGLAQMAAIDPQGYTRSRNFLSGAVSRLSPYLRHGVLTLAEVRNFALERAKGAGDAEKFVNELGWRDYWQRLYAVLGEGIWQDLEPLKTGYAAASYAAALPMELREGTTGLRCMDDFSADLRRDGYLHNHARMWMAAYTVHWLRVRWQAGAAWFLQHLLDGDPASNNLSWQWVASTFSQKPYFFNRENLERYTDGVYCKECPLRNGGCPLEATYEELEMRLFPRAGAVEAEAGVFVPLRSSPQPAGADLGGVKRPMVWVHTDALNPESAVWTRHPEAPAVFVWDEGWLREKAVSSKRAVFLEECLEEMPARMEVRQGEVATEVMAAARAAGADGVVAQRTADPGLLEAARRVGAAMPVVWVDAPAFAEEGRGYDLKRFSRYWRQAQGSAMRRTG